MTRVRIAATKSNLIKVRDELHFAQEGRELLIQKREVLVMELLRLQDDAQKAREELDALLQQAYGAFAQALMVEGLDNLKRFALAVPQAPVPTFEERSVMGVVLPMVEMPKWSWDPGSGLGGGSPAVLEAVTHFLAVTKKVCEVAEIETAIYRLAMETRKTIHRERALDNLFIPQYRETVKFIQESLEEKDREGFYYLKLIKRAVGHERG